MNIKQRTTIRGKVNRLHKQLKTSTNTQEQEQIKREMTMLITMYMKG